MSDWLGFVLFSRKPAEDDSEVNNEDGSRELIPSHRQQQEKASQSSSYGRFFSWGLDGVSYLGGQVKQRIERSLFWESGKCFVCGSANCTFGGRRWHFVYFLYLYLTSLQNILSHLFNKINSYIILSNYSHFTPSYLINDFQTEFEVARTNPAPNPTLTSKLLTSSG